MLWCLGDGDMIILIVLCSVSMVTSSSQSLFCEQEAQILVELLEAYPGKMGGATVTP